MSVKNSIWLSWQPCDIVKNVQRNKMITLEIIEKLWNMYTAASFGSVITIYFEKM